MDGNGWVTLITVNPTLCAAEKIHPEVPLPMGQLQCEDRLILSCIQPGGAGVWKPLGEVCCSSVHLCVFWGETFGMSKRWETEVKFWISMDFQHEVDSIKRMYQIIRLYISIDLIQFDSNSIYKYIMYISLSIAWQPAAAFCWNVWLI